MDTKRREAWVEIDLHALEQNFTAIRAAADGCAVVAAVKADAYGHGAVLVARTLEAAGAGYFGVATFDEAAALREAGIQTPLVMLGTTPRGCEADSIRLGIIPAVSAYEDALPFSEAAVLLRRNEPADIIIALDTGMGRIGFLGDEAARAEIAKIAELPGIRIGGIASHLATSEESDTAYTLGQIASFDEFCGQLTGDGIRPAVRSLANSAAISRFPASRYDAVRSGIMLYGIYPSGEVSRSSLPLTPVMSVRANIVCLRNVPAGFCVSYGKKFITQRESVIATLPLGYADGLPRVLTGTGRVIIRGTFAPIVGTICMDQCMVDVTDVPGAQKYDEATLLGSSGGLSITAGEIAEKAGTITYETLCRFGQRLPKLYR
ncbi:MAG: alanine racemase [Clostridiales Family XIII bacterium]|jgi:alanine racemase|nr:alanine racemase [Clostridiales Family XIII bacterium]